MLTFSKTVRTTQLDIPNKPYSLADKISTPQQTQQALRQYEPLEVNQLDKVDWPASQRIDKVDKFHQTLWTWRNNQLKKKIHQLY